MQFDICASTDPALANDVIAPGSSPPRTVSLKDQNGMGQLSDVIKGPKSCYILAAGQMKYRMSMPNYDDRRTLARTR